MSVRDPGYDPRTSPPRRGQPPNGHPRSGAHPGATEPKSRSSARSGALTPLIVLVALAAVIALGFGSGVLGSGGSPGGPASSALSGLVAGGSPSAGPSVDGAGGASSGPAGATEPPTNPQSSAPPAPGSASPVPGPETDVAIVPATNFRSARTSVRAADIKAIPGGTSPFKGLVLVEADADGILATLGIDRAKLGSTLVTVASADALASDLASHRNRIAFLRADQVGPSVRALAWAGTSLFGADRVKRLDRWPLVARLAGAPSDSPAYDPAAAWTMVAGGDILLDRGVSLAIQASSRGANFPFDGGSVKITGRCKDCSPMGWDLPYSKRTGDSGALRDLVKSADIAIANFENPAPNTFRFHSSGTSFSANPKYIKGLADAGLDWVSLANNHIGDAGRKGIVQTMANLDRYGIAHGGAGHDNAEAHTATLLKAGDVTVGILGYDTIAAGYTAGDSTPGSARMTKKALKADIAAARAAGADVVIVFPHWGIEYRAAPTDRQRDLGHAAIDAGADLVIGNHPHWAEGMEVYKGKPIWYALGNFVFDQTWSEYTMEGLTLEMTFQGTELVQVRMRPHLILGKAQPNFMDPAGSGKFVMDQVWGASKGLLAW